MIWTRAFRNANGMSGETEKSLGRRISSRKSDIPTRKEAKYRARAAGTNGRLETRVGAGAGGAHGGCGNAGGGRADGTGQRRRPGDGEGLSQEAFFKKTAQHMASLLGTRT